VIGVGAVWGWLQVSCSGATFLHGIDATGPHISKTLFYLGGCPSTSSIALQCMDIVCLLLETIRR
jgi:hypothetical protein